MKHNDKRRLILLITLALLLIFPLGLQARAGGGGSSGGSGGSSGGSSSHSSGHSRGTSSPITSLVYEGAFLLMAGAGGIIFAVHLHRKHSASRALLKQIDDLDYHWNEAVLDERVEKTYYAVQRAWSDMDLDTLRAYLSTRLYGRWQVKLAFMEMNHEQNILQDIRLLKHKVVGVGDRQDDEQDFCWYYIKGRMVDYTIDTCNNQLIQGSTKPSSFEEYWRFQRQCGVFVLDEVLQKDEISLDQFTDFSEALESARSKKE